MILYFISITSVIIYDTLFFIIIIIDTLYVLTIDTLFVLSIDIYWVIVYINDCVIESIFEFIIVKFLTKCIFSLGDVKMKLGDIRLSDIKMRLGDIKLRFLFSFVIN